MRTALAAMLALYASAAFGEALWWNQDYEARRQVTVYIPGPVLPGDDAAVVTFRTAGRLKDDGSDIRVVARGRELPHLLYGTGPGDTATIAFKVDRDTREHYIYFGNPNPPAVKSEWQPQRGLVLQTRRYNGGNPRRIADMRTVWEKSGPFHGAGQVDRVWHGQNMFGPSDLFTSLYTGWFVCRTAGQYAFATSSDDGSFLLVDGELAVAWPGFHGPVADARHSGKLNLKAGLHKLEYLHFSAGGTTVAVAAWQQPGAAKFEVIPEAAFAPLSRAVVGPLELKGRRTAADFDFTITGEALLSKEEETYAVRIAFVNASAGSVTNVVRWDFGDGQQANGPSVEHIYLASGVYPVTMQLGNADNSPSISQRISVHQHWGWQTKKDIEDITTYWPVISRYNIEKLDVPSLSNLLILANEQGSTDFAKRVALAAVSKGGVRGIEVRNITARLREIIGTARLAADDRILSGYLEALESARGENRAALALEITDILLERGEPERAAHIAQAALADLAGEPALSRRLYIAYADAARYLGDAAAARNALQAAAETPLERSNLQKAALGGAYAFKAEDAIASREYRAAEQALDAWDIEKPLEKLEGYSSYLRGRLYAAQGRAGRAIREFTAVAAASPGSAYAPKSLLFVAKMEISRGERDAARAALGRILGEYMTSPEAGEAKQMLLGLGGRQEESR